MNKIVIRGVLLSVIIGLLILVLFKTRSPFGKKNSSFASEPQKEITKIEFSKGARKLFLEKKGSDWLLNGKIETRKSGILFILRALQEIKIKSPVSDELFDSEIAAKGIDPVRVKVFEKWKLLKTFLVYKTQSNIYGNIMKIKEGSKPYVVYIPGYEGDIGTGFSSEELFWQPYYVFNLLPSEIASVKFENLYDTASSFSIVSRDQNYSVSDLTRNLTGWDTTLVARYLSYFAWIPFESWAFEIGEEEKLKVETQQPLYRLTVNTADGKKTILTLWERMTNENIMRIKDSDRLFGRTQARDELFIMRYFDIDPLIKKRSYFFPE
jgi:hypothetical protein